ncbi:MAG TPA: peptidoglycan editing factor PgeF [Rhodospirillales bacterium]|nr:peptidoglycan editing factor PgeF [Pseudomonadota bacterium]HIM41289.1 peptidoglycan editing factor PgeF [Rhodospirillales bacterium]
MITSQALNGKSRVRHGFFTREGGVSDGLFSSLNCGFGSGDNPDHITANRSLAMRRLGLEGDDLVTLFQVHSADVVVVDKPWKPGQAPRADAAVTRRPGIALGILSADCAPVLLADSEAGVIGAAHAGWRGALAGIVEATVEAMCVLGAERGRIGVAVGPCIQQDSYEVGAELRAEYLSASALSGDFFKPSDRDGHFMFDLPGYLGRCLDGLGLASVEGSDEDTCDDESRFFSYRRAIRRREKDYGRGLAAIFLTG